MKRAVDETMCGGRARGLGVGSALRAALPLGWLGFCAALACEPGAAPHEPGAIALGRGAQALVLPDGGVVPDAGVDAGASDAGASDAGASDAGRDGGVSDAGVSDAGVSDAGAVPFDAAPPPPTNDCCTKSDRGGCTDPDILACVCEGDSTCCTTEYDSFCATQAVSRCGLDCDERAPVSNCCAPSDVPGCLFASQEECICAIDPFCCIFFFDESCVNIGTSQCGVECN